MAKPDGVFIYIGTYPDRASAEADYDDIKALHAVDAIGGFDAAVVTKDADGKVHINKDETSTRAGALGGAAVGAVVGLLFPPTIIATGIAGGLIGGAGGHLWKGMSRKDVKELGDVIDEGEAALVVVGDVTLSTAVAKADLKATKAIKKDVDASFKELEKQIKADAKS